MSIVELIPLDKGNRLVLDNTTSAITTIGRTPNIGCLDKKISRNHAELHIKPDGTLWIKPIHHNPTFYRTKTQQLITLTKDEEFQLHDTDEIGLLPNEYFYQVSIKSDDKLEESTEPSTVPKSSVQNEDASPPVIDRTLDTSDSRDPIREPEGGIILHTTRSLPAWMSTSSVSEAKTVKGQGKGKKVTTPTKPTPSPSKYRTYIGRQKVESIVYGDDEESDDESASTTITSSDQTGKTASADTTVAVKRERCPYGKFCYRKNPLHRQEAIHPGDPDWDDKENDGDEKKPECPYGSECYRKNPDHLAEFNHSQNRSSNNKTQRRTSKRKVASDAEEDDDGLPNEYDYDDSFIDDVDFDDNSTHDDRKGDSQRRSDNDWKPQKKVGRSDDDADDDPDDVDEIDLLKEEAAQFLNGSSVRDQRPAKKKARLSLPDEYD